MSAGRSFSGPQILRAWSDSFGSPAVTELTPGRVWVIATERERRYVLKKVSTFTAADPVRRFSGEARILGYLLQRGVPVAAPVPSDDGKVCVTGDDDALYAVFPMLPADDAGEDPRSDPALLRNIGAAIARLHLALADCPFDVESWQLGPGHLSAWWRTIEDRLTAGELAELSARVQPRSEAIVRALSAAPQRVHGDVHGGNLLTDGHRVTGIIDCDHLPLAPRGYDLGYFVAFAARWWLDHDPTPRSAGSRPAGEIVPFITRHLLTGYHAASRLSRQDNDDVPALALGSALALIDYFITEHDLVEPSWLRAARWIGDNFDELRLPASAVDDTPTRDQARPRRTARSTGE